MRVVQLLTGDGERRVGRVSEDGRSLATLADVPSVYELALKAAREARPLAQIVAAAAVGDHRDLAEELAAGRVLPPLDHSDPAHCLITGTGLTHIGSAQARDAMHQVEAKDEADLTDSMRMFRLGLQGGRPQGERPGVAPEWFYKGDGSIVVAPEHPLEMPAFALDGGEEAEIAILFLIDDHGRPRRIGYALGNEFSDHVLERRNYLYLAHSKLRPCAFGPELLLGDLPDDIVGAVRVRRRQEVLFESEFRSGEANMCHSLANLEHHHFKYRQFRRPGDVHVHFIGAPVLSFTSAVEAEAGDVFEIEAPAFGMPLRNALAVAPEEAMVRAMPL